MSNVSIFYSIKIIKQKILPGLMVKYKNVLGFQKCEEKNYKKKKIIEIV